jgi:Fe-S cluster assembly protein SufD
VTIAVIKTKGETSLAEQFAANVAKLPGGVAMQAVRKTAFGAFVARGLPHRRIEEWKYTDLRAALKEPIAVSVQDDTNMSAKEVATALGALASLPADRIVFVNGCYRAELSAVSKQKGLDITPLSADWAVAGGSHVAVPSSAALADESVVDLNTALVTDGALVRVADGVVLSRPVMILHISAGRAVKLASTRHVLSVGAGAQATLIEVFASTSGQVSAQTNAVTELMAGDGARVTHLKVSTQPNAAHVASWGVRLGAETVYRAFQLTSSSAMTRNQTFLTFTGEGAKIDISGLMLGRGHDHIDTTLVIDHAVPGCESRELFKTVLDDHGRSVFQGKVIVRPNAQKTDGKQMANALMLSEHAEFDSKPELEIYADDVVCGHGATCIELNKDLLFYMRARGLPLAQARALLIESFAGEALDRIEDEALRAALREMTSAWLAGAAVPG